MTLPLLLLCAAGAIAPADDVLARVDAVNVTRADFDERVRALAAARATMAPDRVVSDLVDEAVLAAEARRLGLDREPAVAAEIEAQRRRLALDAYVHKLGESAQPPEASLREMYHSTEDALRLILVKVATEAEARAALERIRKGGDIAQEARNAMDPRLAPRGGDTGWLIRASLDPKLAEVAFAAKPGELVGPVALDLGWAVARLVEKRIGDEKGFAARKAALLSHARKQAAESAKTHVLAQLKQKAAVTLDEPFLRSLGIRTDATPDELAHVIATINGTPVRYAEVHRAAARLLGAVKGHGIGANVRIDVAWREIDDRLLKDEAMAQGFGNAPAVVAAMPGISRNLAARAVAARVGKSPSVADPEVAKRLTTLRSQARVRIERDKVAALLRSP